jgi:predicted type IV restriction endonuclease
MANIPNKVRERLIAGLKKFQPILTNAKTRDINEADTVTLVKDLLESIFGYDKYTEITSEFAIRGTYVDLAIKIDGTLEMLMEVKAIGLELKDAFVKQAVDYAANQGLEWVVLTNGVTWQIYRVIFKQPIEQELVVKLDLLSASHKSEADQDALFLLSKEGLGKSLLGEYHAQRQALSRYFIGAMLFTEPVLDVVRRELRRISPDVKIDNEQIVSVLLQEVLKRDVVEGEKAEEAQRKIIRAMNRAQRKTAAPSKQSNSDNSHTPPQPVAEIANEQNQT